MVFQFGTLLGNLNEIGFYEFLLPFALFTTLTYALFRKIKLFEEGQGVDILLSLCVGFFVINYTSLGAYLSHLFSISSIVIALGVSIILITATLGVDFPEYMSERKGGALMLAVFIILLVILETGVGKFLSNIDSLTMKLILFVAVFIAMISFAGKLPPK